MTKTTDIPTLLSQRRVWAAICAFIALVVNALGIEFDSETATSAVMSVVEAITALGAIGLPIWSYFFPKKAELEETTAEPSQTDPDPRPVDPGAETE